MERLLMDGVIHTDYGQFDVVYDDDGGFDGDWPRFFTGQVNGLVGATDEHGIYLNLARRSGGSHIRIAVYDDEPGLDQIWEDVVEVSSIVPPGCSVRWMSWAGESSGELGAIAPGEYRVRVSATGRDRGAANEFADVVLDSYLVQLWAAPMSPDTIVRSTSENAAYWHREVGGR